MRPRKTASRKAVSRKPISRKQLLANRRNAKKSTGPRTPRGKRIVARNSITHGFTSQNCIVLPGESEIEYRALADAVMRDLQPDGVTQREVVQQMIDLQWKLRRIPEIEAALVEADLARLEAQFERQKEEGDIDEAATFPPRCGVAMIAASFASPGGERAYERLEMYRVRLERGLHASLRHLERLRKMTTGAEISARHQLEQIAEAIAESDAKAAQQTPEQEQKPEQEQEQKEKAEQEHASVEPSTSKDKPVQWFDEYQRRLEMLNQPQVARDIGNLQSKAVSPSPGEDERDART